MNNKIKWNLFYYKLTLSKNKYQSRLGFTKENKNKIYFIGSGLILILEKFDIIISSNAIESVAWPFIKTDF